MGHLFDALLAESQLTTAIRATPAIADDASNRTIAGIAARRSFAAEQDRRLLRAIRECGFADSVLSRDDSGSAQLRYLNDAELSAYAGVLGRTAMMEEGRVPDDYTQPSLCQRCGPVWLWPGAPAVLDACPWCLRRRLCRTPPSPPVICGDCAHFLPNRINPAGGTGCCGMDLPYRRGERGRYPFTPRQCEAYSPA
jgi:hypothetical protein